ncbi:MAG: hypothetical protein ACLR1A_02010 [Eubacterium ventriosum]
MEEEENREKVNIMTMHGQRLEFKAVFIIDAIRNRTVIKSGPGKRFSGRTACSMAMTRAAEI